MGLPVASVSEKQLLSTVFHVQHGRNLCGSVCHLTREDVDFVSTVLSRFETACRRIIGVSQAEYDQAGGHGLLHCGLGAMKFGPGPPSNSVFLCADQAKEGGVDTRSRNAHGASRPSKSNEHGIAHGSVKRTRFDSHSKIQIDPLSRSRFVASSDTQLGQSTFDHVGDVGM